MFKNKFGESIAIVSRTTQVSKANNAFTGTSELGSAVLL